MNDKDWQDDPEFWDNDELEEDEEDDYNGLGSDIDANNDETFANASEWNEDEHLDLIARDMIRPQPKPSPPRQPVQQAVSQPVSQPQVLTVDELERQLLKTSISQSSQPQQQPRTSRAQPETSRRAGWSPFGGKDLFRTDDPLSAGPATLLDPGLYQNIQPQTLTLEQQQHLLIQQQQLLHQHQQLQQLALMKQLHHQQHQQQQQQHERQQLQQEQLKRLALLRQQQQQKQHPLQQHRQQQHFAFFAQHQTPVQQLEPKPAPPPTMQCITVEELERQMLANRSNNIAKNEPEVDRKSDNGPGFMEKRFRNQNESLVRHSDEARHRNTNERRNGERNDRYERNNRVTDDPRENFRDRRENRNRDHRENFRLHKREPIIVPPQSQLSVIVKAKRKHSITTMHQDEFIRDRMPVSGKGFRFLRHSEVAKNKVEHDGVLTDRERDWLIRIQEKIQADYDNNLDQDYYYLLYFNRSSMSDEAALKPSGPGVLDRRFIPRERLLYNSGV